jgi:predicted ribosomally synthesized peptide with SipW-like signal peptide
MNRNKMFIAGFMLLFLLVVGSTMAYLIDTDSKSNIFTFGNVDIELTEPHWVAANALNVVPGQVLPKDPKLTNTGNTNAYVFMDVTMPCVGNIPVFSFTVNSGWTSINGPVQCSYGQGTASYVYGTSTTATSLAPSASTPTLFDSVTVASLTDEQIDQLPSSIELVINGLAVQAEGDNTGNGHSDDPQTLIDVFSIVG